MMLYVATITTHILFLLQQNNKMEPQGFKYQWKPTTLYQPWSNFVAQIRKGYLSIFSSKVSFESSESPPSNGDVTCLCIVVLVIKMCRFFVLNRQVFIFRETRVFQDICVDIYKYYKVYFEKYSLTFDAQYWNRSCLWMSLPSVLFLLVGYACNSA